MEFIRPCNGKILFQMHKMIEEDSNFAYSSIRTDSNNKITFRNLAEFSFELKQLFSTKI